MQTTRRELLFLVLIGLCSLAAIRAGAQVEGADGDSGSAFGQPRSAVVERAQSSGDHVGHLITLALQQATMKEALRAIASQAEVRLIYNDSDLPADRLVTVTISDATVEQALAIVLRGTWLQARRTEVGIAIEPRSHSERSERRVLQGSVTGRVTDAATGRPIPAVAVRLEEASLATSTGSEGTYRFPSVSAGTYTLTARQVGYERATRTVVVKDGEDLIANLAMTRSPTILDQVVTTGTLIPTEVKALPTPITVITGEQIARQHPLTFAAILRQAVPTAVAFNSPDNPTATQISVRGASSLLGAGNMKIFVDGVEATEYSFTPVDPASIDRIEVVRGPQAATMYGSDAAGGVIQIFTKRGNRLTHPQVDLQLAGGVMQTPYADFGAVPRQQYSGSVHGGGEDVTYSFGGGYSHMADYLPHGEISRQSASSVYGGMHFTSDVLSADISARYLDTDAPVVSNPLTMETGYVPRSQPRYMNSTSTNETLGARLSAAPTSWWHSQASIGIERFTTHNSQARPRNTTPSDTLLSLTHYESRKVSLAISSSVSGTLNPDLTGSLTIGVDHFAQPIDLLSTSRALNLEGTIQTSPPGLLIGSITRTTNTGYFVQTQLGWRDALFATAGVRAEDNSTFGADYGPAVLPRVGLTMVRGVGGATLKVRASYGKALRAPTAGEATGSVSSGYIKLANPLLAAETQAGWDGGVDLVFGDRGSVSVSGYTQSARDLIAFMQVATSPLPTYQYQNVGQVSNRGIEVEGKLSISTRLRMSAQYGYVRSRFVSVGDPNGTIEVGDEPLGIPSHTAGAALTVTPSNRMTFTAGVTYVGNFRQTDFLAEYRCLASRTEPACPSAYLSTGSVRYFTATYPSFTKINVGVTRELSDQLDVFLAIDNLANNRAYEGTNTAPVAGRNTMLGIHIRL
ncbi:MAG TPA: TonB-dependent receptor [Gemmatimonadaceae bacterium]